MVPARYLPDAIDFATPGSMVLTRRVLNGACYLDEGGRWCPSDRRLRVGENGRLGYGAAPVQVGLGETGDASRTLLATSHREIVARKRLPDAMSPDPAAKLDEWQVGQGSPPAMWAAYSLVGARDASVDLDGDSASATAVLVGHSLRRTARWDGLKTEIVVDGPDHLQAEYRWRFRLPAGVTLDGAPAPDGSYALRCGGVEWGRVRAPIAYYLDTVSELPTAVPMVVGRDGDDLVLQVPEWPAKATSLVIDPTTTISGTGDLEDNMALGGSTRKDRNYGASTVIPIGNFSGWGTGPTDPWSRGLYRVAASAIPAASIQDCRLYLYVDTNGEKVDGGGTLTISPRAMLAASGDWVEGTANDVAQNGSSCWNHKAYDPTTPTAWAGGGGMAGGSDFSNTALDSVVFSSASAELQYYEFTLGAAWAVEQRDVGEYGVVLDHERAIQTALNHRMIFQTTEAGANTPYVEVDWMPGSGETNRRRRGSI